MHFSSKIKVCGIHQRPSGQDNTFLTCFFCYMRSSGLQKGIVLWNQETGDGGVGLVQRSNIRCCAISEMTKIILFCLTDIFTLGFGILRIFLCRHRIQFGIWTGLKCPEMWLPEHLQIWAWGYREFVSFDHTSLWYLGIIGQVWIYYNVLC